MEKNTISLIERYYDSFNKRDLSAFLSLLDQNVVHDINQGRTEVGIDAFKAFMNRMDNAYSEQATSLVVMANANGSRAAAEFYIDGVYKVTDKGLPIADNQKYRLRCGAFFEIMNNKITRVTNYYNLQSWLTQVKE